MYDYSTPEPYDVLGVDEEEFKQWDVDKQRRVVRDAVDFDEYARDGEREISPSDCTAYNPALEAYQVTHDWKKEGWRPVEDTSPYRSCPAYVPTQEAIETLSQMSLVAVEAGGGYWAHVVNEAGGDVLPADSRPPELPSHLDAPVTEFECVEDERFYETLWADVIEAGYEALEWMPERDVLLRHPEGFSWTENLLDAMYPSQRLVLVAEWYPGADATVEFFRKLADEWRLVDEFPVYDWATMHAGGYVFERR